MNKNRHGPIDTYQYLSALLLMGIELTSVVDRTSIIILVALIDFHYFTIRNTKRNN